jgi:hypothetical protein
MAWQGLASVSFEPLRCQPLVPRFQLHMRDAAPFVAPVPASLPLK